MYTIYCLINNVAGKVYVGQTKRFKYRMNQHKNCRNEDAYISNAIKKYGWENFTVKTLEENVSEDEVDEREKYWIAHFNSTHPVFGYSWNAVRKYATYIHGF